MSDWNIGQLEDEFGEFGGLAPTPPFMGCASSNANSTQDANHARKHKFVETHLDEVVLARRGGDDTFVRVVLLGLAGGHTIVARKEGTYDVQNWSGAKPIDSGEKEVTS